jgi:hypothetical protein
MRPLICLTLCVLPCFAAFPATAQSPPENGVKIEFDSHQRANFAGNLKASGSFTFDDGVKLTVVSIILECAPTNGGHLASEKCKWNGGKWECEIVGLAPGAYNLKAAITGKDRGDKETTWVTPFLKVNVGPAVVAPGAANKRANGTGGLPLPGPREIDQGTPGAVRPSRPKNVGSSLAQPSRSPTPRREFVAGRLVTAQTRSSDTA